MPATIWTGTISFGLVTVPVRLTPATRSRDVSFHQLEEGTGARIRYRKVSEATGEEVPNDRIAKGYEISRGNYVLVDPEELQALRPASTRTIEIEDFVDLDEIDPIYFQQPYHVLPDKGAVKPYRLLVEAMQGLRKVAIGRVVIRSKGHLVAIRPRDGLLCIETMRYADEVVDPAELGGVPGEEVELAERELDMARQLVEALSGKFDPDKYRDEYREELLALIERKAAGEEIVAEPVVEAPAKVLDLMSALEASLARAADGEQAKPARRRGGRQAAGGTKATRAGKATGARKAAETKATKKGGRAKRPA
ncbi:MAG: Ku protein [Acidimicrobiia bacterium]|nr:Ku protein [Acidimicrobiia bacterium]